MRLRDFSIFPRRDDAARDRRRSGSFSERANNERRSESRLRCHAGIVRSQFKGHLDAHIFLFAVPNEIWIDADAELREQLQGRVERYIIADYVLVEDASEGFALFHVLAELKPEGVEANFCVRSRRLGRDGWDLWVESVEAKEATGALAATYQPADENEWERLRIENGIPRWGRELTPDIIPPEANLAERAIDYEKGCYIGQEVISRIKMSGQLRQRLCGLISEKRL